MKRLVLALSFVCAPLLLFSQESTINLEDKVFNVGVGLAPTYYHGIYWRTIVPPVSASIEYAIKDELIDKKGVLSVGAYTGFAYYDEHYSNYIDTYGWKHSVVIIAARGVFHYPLVDKLDTYTGLMLGGILDNSSEYGTSYAPGVATTTRNRALLSWFVGARHYFKDNIAAMAEIGYGISWLNIGVSYKF